MAEILFDSVIVNTTLQDRIASAPTLEIPLIFDPDLTGTITNLTSTYNSLSSLAVDFPSTTKVYKCAEAHYSQPGHNSVLKVGRASVGDTDITDSLDKLWAQDKSFTSLLTTTKDETEWEEIADWMNADAKPLIFGTSQEPTSEMLDANDTTDFASVIAAKGYSNVYCAAHWESGVDATAATIVIASEIATVSQTAHGLRVGDPFTGSTSSEPLANGNKIVATVPDANSFTFSVTGAADLSSESYDYFARYLFFESGLQGFQLGKAIGSSTWAYKTITGQTAVPKTFLSDDQIQVLRNKKYIVYTEPQNNISVTNDGFMVSGRQIVDETVRIFIDLNVAVEVFNLYILNEKVPYTNGGFLLIRGAIQRILNAQLGIGGLNPLNDTQPYIINMPDALSADPADRQAGIVPPIEVTARIGSSVLKTTINVVLIV